MAILLAIFSMSGVAVIDSNPHAGHTTYTFDLLCVVTISTSLKSWSHSIFELPLQSSVMHM